MISFCAKALARAILICVSSTVLLCDAWAQQTQESRQISTNLFGLFFEDINYAADGGLYAELVQNRSFGYSPTSRRDWSSFSFWEYVTPGFSYGSINVETNSPIHPNNPRYVVLDIEHVGSEKQYTGVSGVGIKNTGYDGMVVAAGEKYNLSLFARQLTDTPIDLLVSLQTPNGDILAESRLSTSSKDWKKYTASLGPSASTDSASLVILATSNGKLALDMISLFPENTFKNRPNGLRADLAQVVADMKPAFIRFPGGCLVHGDGLGNMYRWKNTVGPVEERVEQKNLWGYHQTMGLGFFEYFQFCEDVGAVPVPVVPAAVSCQNSGGTWRIGGTGQRAMPMSELDDYIQEILDLIEWANGPVSSTWGSIRAAAGHPEPFNLQYIGIGNEDKITPEFEERFRLIYEAVHARHPEITLIGTVGPFSDGEDFEKGWALANELGLQMIDEHYYKEPDWFMANLYRYDGYDRSQAKVYLGEYASWGNKMQNAIVEAAYMIGLERNGDIVSMASYAPLLAKKNHTQWKTDMIFFDNSKICLTPNYHVQKMFMTNQGDTYYEGVIALDKSDSTLAASCVGDSRSGDLILKIVNTGEKPKETEIDLSGFNNLSKSATKMLFSGDPEAENTYESPNLLIPEDSEIKISRTFRYTTPPMSLTVIRVEAR